VNKTEKIKNHFEDEAKEFDEIILNLIPYYKQMVEALVLSIPFDKEENIEVIDLGCGTGTLASSIKQRFKNSQITCLDIADNMISVAKTKLEKFRDIRYIVSDFYKFNFYKDYDVIVSSLALHHLADDEDKKMFYRKIYDSLTNRGVFLLNHFQIIHNTLLSQYIFFF